MEELYALHSLDPTSFLFQMKSTIKLNILNESVELDFIVIYSLL